MLNHYKDIVDRIFVVVYKNSEDDTIEQEVREITDEIGCGIHEVIVSPIFNWNVVTSLYNKTKRLYPDDWWIVSDDDEFQIYHDSVPNIIDECEEYGWEFVTGGFIDRLGEYGTFPEIQDSDIWAQFPLAGFFRYPISKACPNKVCLMKGRIDVTPGQHYALIDGQTTWREFGWNHPLRYPVKKGFVQVHHFKWDSSVIARLKEISNIKEDYTYHWEYKVMYDYLIRRGVDTRNPDFLIERCLENDYWDYPHWDLLIDKIIDV